MKRILLFMLFLSVSASSSWATIFHHEILDHLKPAGLAEIAAHIYGDGIANLPNGVELVSDAYVGCIRLGYYKYSHQGLDRYILAVRGSDNASNFCEDALRLYAGLAGPPLQQAPLDEEAFVRTLEEFERANGRCSFMTGHSLGGFYLECFRGDLFGISFNGYKNNDRPNIMAYRTLGDSAKLSGGCHTDRWIDNVGGEIIDYYYTGRGTRGDGGGWRTDVYNEGEEPDDGSHSIYSVYGILTHRFGRVRDDADVSFTEVLCSIM